MFISQVILMLMTILSVFAVCWLPLQVSILYSEHRSDKSEVIMYTSVCARIITHAFVEPNYI